MDRLLDIIKLFIMILVWGYINIFIIFGITFIIAEIVDSIRRKLK